MALAIETRRLTKIFKKGRGFFDLFGKRRKNGRHVAALDGVDLTVGEGEIFALLGPNGAGKTTLIRLLSTLILPNGGEAKVLGLDTVKQAKKIRKGISLVLGEEGGFYNRLTGRQNLEFFATLYNLSKKAAALKIEEAAGQLEIEDLEKRYQEYSTGMKHRLGLARSFLSDAGLVFLDEPTRSLDPSAAAKFRELIRLRSGQNGPRTVFFTTHNTAEAEGLADRIAILDRGKVRGCGSLEELRRLAGAPNASLEKIFHRLTAAEPPHVF